MRENEAIEEVKRRKMRRKTMSGRGGERGGCMSGVEEEECMKRCMYGLEDIYRSLIR